MTPAEQLADQIKSGPVKKEKRTRGEVVWETALRKYRDSLGLTRSDVANAIGVTVFTIIHLEQGKSDPSISICLALAKFYGVQVTDLWVKYVGGKRYGRTLAI